MKGDHDMRSSAGKVAASKFDGRCRHCGKYGHKSETTWATSSTKPTEKGHGSKGKHGKQVNVIADDTGAPSSKGSGTDMNSIL